MVDHLDREEILFAGVIATALAQSLDDVGKIFREFITLKIENPRFPVIAVGKRRIEGFTVVRAPREAMQRENDIDFIRAGRFVAAGWLHILDAAGMEMAQIVGIAAMLKSPPLQNAVPGSVQPVMVIKSSMLFRNGHKQIAGRSRELEWYISGAMGNVSLSEATLKTLATAAASIKGQLRNTVEIVRPFTKQKGQKSPPSHPSSSSEIIDHAAADLSDATVSLKALNAMLRELLPKLLGEG